MSPRADADGGLLEIERLSQSFGGMVAVSDLSLTVEPGEMFGIIGPNGAGKTTILNCVNRINRSYSGAIRVGGEELRCPPSAVARHGVSRTFQSADVFLDFPVIDFLQLARLDRQRKSLLASAVWLPGVRRDERREREQAYAWLERFGFAELAARQLRELSYGTRKILDILRAAFAEPRILLLDEPTSGVALSERTQISDILRAVNAGGCTLVIVDHDVGFISQLSARILAINYGQTLGIGRPEEILARQEVIDSYIGGSVAGPESGPAAEKANEQLG